MHKTLSWYWVLIASNKTWIYRNTLSSIMKIGVHNLKVDWKLPQIYDAPILTQSPISTHKWHFGCQTPHISNKANVLLVPYWIYKEHLRLSKVGVVTGHPPHLTFWQFSAIPAMHALDCLCKVCSKISLHFVSVTQKLLATAVISSTAHGTHEQSNAFSARERSTD